MYDGQIGRWNVVDPLASRYFEWSPYVYCANNPFWLVDLDGRSWSVSEDVNSETGVKTISNSPSVKVVNGKFNQEQLSAIFALAQEKMKNALNGTVTDGMTVYDVSYSFTTIDAEDIQAEAESDIVLHFSDISGLGRQGDNKSNSQNGFSQIDPSSRGKMLTADNIASILNHELGHGVKLSHPYEEDDLADIAQYKI
jgi:hypothetical protein